MKPTLLMIGPLLPNIMQEIEHTYTVHRYWEATDTGELLNTIATDCVGVVTDGGRGVDRMVLQQLPNADIVAVYGVGVDAVDLDYCREKDIHVTNTPDVLSDDVADLAVALALASCRQLAFADRYIRSGQWPTKGALPLGTRLTGKCAGIFGLGSIGSCLAKRLSGFDMDISYCNRSPRSDVNFRWVPSVEQLASEVDFLFVTASATTDSIGAINQSVLNALGDTGYLINVSRGSLVDEPALLDALSKRVIAGAGLDVFAAEPSVPEAFFDLDNVVLQPHQASGTHETRQAMGQLVIDNLAAHFSASSLLTPVF